VQPIGVKGAGNAVAGRCKRCQFRRKVGALFYFRPKKDVPSAEIEKIDKVGARQENRQKVMVKRGAMGNISKERILQEITGK